MFIDMEAQIHLLEQEAYIAVLRAFKAQSDAITWEKEGLITELRKELRVSDDEHRELLTRVNADNIIQRIREWRQGDEHQVARFSASQPVHDVTPSPTVSASRKKQKTSQLVQTFSALSASKSMQYRSSAPSANRHFASYGSSGALLTNTYADATTSDPLIGRKVWTRWPEDNNFYEATITEYNPREGRHALVYDIHTANETWEWVDLKEISPEDIQWEGGVHGGIGPGIQKPLSHGGFFPNAGRGRGSAIPQFRRDIRSYQNGYTRRIADEIELLNTEALVKEVERIFRTTRLDPFELDKAKKMLQEQEKALVDAIAKLADASDDESDGEQHLFHDQAMVQG